MIFKEMMRMFFLALLFFINSCIDKEDVYSCKRELNLEDLTFNDIKVREDTLLNFSYLNQEAKLNLNYDFSFSDSTITFNEGKSIIRICELDSDCKINISAQDFFVLFNFYDKNNNIEIASIFRSKKDKVNSIFWLNEGEGDGELFFLLNDEYIKDINTIEQSKISKIRKWSNLGDSKSVMILADWYNPYEHSFDVYAHNKSRVTSIDSSLVYYDKCSKRSYCLYRKTRLLELDFFQDSLILIKNNYEELYESKYYSSFFSYHRFLIKLDSTDTYKISVVKEDMENKALRDKAMSFKLAKCYLFANYGFSKDMDKAKYWLEVSSSHGNIIADKFLKHYWK